jgi:dipeptidyl aminopeptidase/acylaminoacyl peptidase
MSAAMLCGGRRLVDPQLSPDGSWVSVLTRMGGRTELSVIDLSSGIERQLPLEPGVASSRGGSHKWLPNGDGIAYLAGDGRLHVFDLGSLISREITAEEQPCSALAVSNNGLLAAYVVDLQDVFVVALDGSSPPVRLTTDADFVVDPVFSLDNQRVAWVEWDVPHMAWDESRIVARDVAAAEGKRVVYAKPNVAVQQPRWSPDGRMLSFLSDESGWTNLWCVDAKTLDNPRQLIKDEFDNGDLTWGPGQSTYAWTGVRRLYMSRTDEGFGLVQCRDISDGEVVEQFQGAVSNVHAVGNTVVSLITDHNRATELVVFEKEQERTLARTAYLGVDRGAVLPTAVQWKSTDGTNIPGRLYRASAGPAPMIVWVHGGPHGQSPATFYPRWTYFIERGWNILVVDQRGTSGWGREYLQALRGQYGEADVNDVKSGIDAAIENGWCDSSRVVVYGGSSAGLVVLELLARHPTLCAAGVAPYPVTDMESTAKDTWRFEAHYFDSLVGPLPEKRDLYAARSPMTHAAAIKTPVLLLHGTEDESVPVTQSTELAQAIAEAGGTVEVHLYEGEGHGWRKTETQIDELERVEAFVSRYVLDVAKEERSS